MKRNTCFQLFQFLLFVFVTSFGQQNDIKVRTLGVFGRNYGVSYELSSKKAIAFNISYNTTNKRPVLFGQPSDFENTSDYKHYNISPEIRFYYKGGGKGTFTGFYFRYQKSISGKLDTNRSLSFDQTYKGMSAGITYGYKFVQRKGFLVELLFGGGYVFDRKFTFSDELIPKNFTGFSDESTDEIDPRFSIQIGYRF